MFKTMHALDISNIALEFIDVDWRIFIIFPISSNYLMSTLDTQMLGYHIQAIVRPILFYNIAIKMSMIVRINVIQVNSSEYGVIINLHALYICEY